MQKLKRWLHAELTGKIPKVAAYFLLIAGVVLGLVFTVGEYYWHQPVERADARDLQAAYEGCEVHYRRSTHVLLRFADYDGPLDVPTECVTQSLVEEIQSIPAGTVLELKLHPRSNVILELRSHGRTLLNFEETSARLNARVHSFRWLGLFTFLCAAFGAWKLWKREVF